MFRYHLTPVFGSTEPRGKGNRRSLFLERFHKQSLSQQVLFQPSQKLFLGKEGFDLCPDNGAQELTWQAVKLQLMKALAFVLT